MNINIAVMLQKEEDFDDTDNDVELHIDEGSEVEISPMNDYDGEFDFLIE